MPERITVKIYIAGHPDDALYVTFNYYPELGSLDDAVSAVLSDYIQAEVLVEHDSSDASDVTVQ